VIGRPLSKAAQGFTTWFVRGGLGAKLSRMTANDYPFGYALVLHKR